MNLENELKIDPLDATNVSSYPMPPLQLIKMYTDENVTKGVAPKPPPPIQGIYKCFGIEYGTDDTIIQSLESQSIKRLYPTHHFDHKKELKKLNHSILVNFLDLLSILVNNPNSQERVQKLEDLHPLFINMHHLINEYRPHQARETLRVMLEVQKRQRIEATTRFTQIMENTKQLINQTIRFLDSNIEIPLMPEASNQKTGLESGAKTAFTAGLYDMDISNRSITIPTETSTTNKSEIVSTENSLLCTLVDSVE